MSEHDELKNASQVTPDNGAADAEDAATEVEPPTEQVDGPADDPPEDDPVVEELPPQPSAEVRTLRDTVAALETRLRTVSAAFQQQRDEINAVRGRLERQAAADSERRRGEVVASLFEPTENLRRSLKAIRAAGIAEDLVAGLDMTLHQFMDAFHKLGLEEVPGKGAKFDPSLHEAIALTPVTDPALDGIVLDVFSAGYRIGNRLIAPARVIIGQKAEPEGEA